jgi:hypothetical protein
LKGCGGARSHFRTGLRSRNSLLTGKTTGNFDVLADGIEIQQATQSQNQRVAEIFPAQRSRELLSLNRESQGGNREANNIQFVMHLFQGRGSSTIGANVVHRRTQRRSRWSERGQKALWRVL